MSYRILVDFVEPAPNVDPNVVQFVYSEDLRVAVIYADHAGYRVVWDAHGDYTPLAPYVSHSLSECQCHIQVHAPAWAEAHAQYVELSD
jgi:hypothetical protein